MTMTDVADSSTAPGDPAQPCGTDKPPILAAEGRFLARPGDDHTKAIFDPAIRGKTDQYALTFVKPRG